MALLSKVRHIDNPPCYLVTHISRDENLQKTLYNVHVGAIVHNRDTPALQSYRIVLDELFTSEVPSPSSARIDF